ncbi:MAG: pentapeptide repeat-containing protein [Bacteroidota bacterium]
MPAKEPHKISVSSYGYEEKRNSRRLIIDTLDLILSLHPRTKGLKTDHILNVASSAGWMKNENQKAFALIHKSLLSAGLDSCMYNFDLFTTSFSKKSLKLLSENLAAKLEAIHLELDGSFFENPIRACQVEKFVPTLAFWLQHEGKLREEKAELLANELGNYFEVQLIKQWRKHEDYWQDIVDFFKGTPFSKGYIRRINMKMYQNSIKTLYFKPVMGDEKGMSLQDVYIEPDFRIHEQCFDREDRRGFVRQSRQPHEEAFAKVPFEGSIHQYVEAFLARENPLELSSGNAQVMILLGYPGQGKTSFCARTIYDYLNGPFEKPIYFVRLRDLEHPRELISSLEETLRHHLEKEISEFSEGLGDQAFRNAFWILDGLDELHMKEDFSHEDILRFCDKLADLSSRRPDLQILFTSRYGYITLDKLQKERFQILRLEPFSEGQQLKWLKNYKNYYPETELKEEVLHKINEPGNSLNHLQDLATQPILLHLIATSKGGLKEGDKRVSIYSNLFNTLIERKWSKDRSLDQHRNLKPKDLEKYLMEIALAIYQSDHEYIRSIDLGKLEASEKFMKKLEGKSMGDILKNLMVSFYFREVNKNKIDKGDDHQTYAIEFLHKSLMEYLVAKKIWQILKKLIGRDEEEYTIDSWKSVLEKLAMLFGPKSISEEVWVFLKEIIDLEKQESRHELKKRMYHFFPFLFKRDFLHDSFIGPHVIDKAINCFLGFWTSFSLLGLDQNYISKSLKDRFTYFLKNLPYTGYRELLLVQQKLTEVDLRGVNLRGADLRGIDLSRSSLRGADLKDADIQEANLEIVDFIGANLSGANLIGADLDRAFLSGADLRGADLSGVSLIGADLSRSDLRGANLSGADLSGASLIGADLSVADLSRAVLIGANLSEANLIGANLSGVNLLEAYFSKFNLSGANFRGANLRGADFRGEDLIGVDFCGADLIEADLRRADLSGANLSGVDLSGVDLRGANLRGANLSGADISGADISGVDLGGADFSEAKFHIDQKGILIQAGIDIESITFLNQEE